MKPIRGTKIPRPFSRALLPGIIRAMLLICPAMEIMVLFMEQLHRETDMEKLAEPLVLMVLTITYPWKMYSVQRQTMLPYPCGLVEWSDWSSVEDILFNKENVFEFRITQTHMHNMHSSPIGIGLGKNHFR